MQTDAARHAEDRPGTPGLLSRVCRWGRRSSVLAVALVAALLSLTAACSTSAAGVRDEGASSPAADTPLIDTQPAEHSADDVSFVANVLAQLRNGMDLSALAPERSAHAGILAFAQKSADTMQSHINVARALQLQWTDGTGSGVDPAQPGAGAVATVEAASAQDFDKVWLQAALDQHKAALDLANGEVAKGKAADAIGLARQMVLAEQASIEEINQLRNEAGIG